MSNSTDKEQVMTSQLYDGPIYSIKLNRFDDEFIDEYFTDEGKQAIQAYLATHRDAAVREAEVNARIDERENMKFIDVGGNEVFKPYVQYRYCGDGLILNWEDRTTVLAELQQTNQKERL